MRIEKDFLKVARFSEFLKAQKNRPLVLQKALFIENEKGGIRKDERQKKHRISCRWRATFSSFEAVAIRLSIE